MKMTNWFLAVAVLVAQPWLLGGETLPAYYAKKATWHETLAAAREGLAKQETEQAAKPAAQQAEQFTPWHHIGAFQNPGKSSFSEVFPPETEIDLNKSYDKLRWTVHPEWNDGVVHDLQTPGNSATYLYRTVTVKAPKTITGYFGSDDGMIFWLNGKKLISNDTPRGAGPNQDQAKLELVAGENKLLFKIHNQGGGCGFYFSTSPNPGTSQSPQTAAREKLWEYLQRDFTDPDSRRQLAWERQDNIWSQDWPFGTSAVLAERYANATRSSLAAQARELAKSAKEAADLEPIRKLYYRARAMEEVQAQWKDSKVESLRLAINDLMQTYGSRYAKGPEYLQRLADAQKVIADTRGASGQGTGGGLDRFIAAVQQFEALRAEALLASPALDFDKLLVIKRNARQLGLPQNWQGNCALARSGYDNEIAVLSPVGPQGKLTTLYKPQKDEFVGDVDLHFDGDKMLFSMPGANHRWQIWEIKTDGSGLRQVTPGDQPDVDNYDPCYLPEGKIIFASTGCFHGVPCVGGGNAVANLYRMDADGRNIRQLCFDQDHNWCPTVTNDGRVIYTRWEYSDTPHYFTRILFRMNPDGTGQQEYYGSNSYWPNSLFYARPIPNHPTKVVGVISGHHGVPRMGELVLFDPAQGRFENGGAVQRIPGYGKAVPPTIADGLVEGSWPKFLHPYPLSDKYFLVSSQLAPNAPWAVYLVDIFDNMVPVCEVPGYAMLEPVPLRATPKPPIIPERVDTSSRDATVYLTDVYAGEGLRGVPRGTVKKLRIYEPHYAYNGMGGHINIGIDGPWDVHRIIGTVPVAEDGSAEFKVPANTPLAVQPLDAEGKALQVMRSWFTAMPGEALSCVGCHDRQNSTPPGKRSLAMLEPCSEITPWYGPARGFSFKRDVQPALDKFCVGCHGGNADPAKNVTPDLAAKQQKGWRNFTQSYIALHPYVRRPGPESDYHLQVPLEYHADTSELVQILKKGHYGVKLDAEAWDRLITWIDLNVPDHGTWREHRGGGDFNKRRLALRTLYANRPEDPEAIPDLKQEPVKFVEPAPMAAREAKKIECAGWPFAADEAQKKQAAAAKEVRTKIPLSETIAMEFAVIPAGGFVMGSADGALDEWPQTAAKIEKPFLMGVYEVTNEQYAVFDAVHDSDCISMYNKDMGGRGQQANRPKQPVIRVSWEQAMAFCDWLSKKTGRKFALPTEAQWEYACRAGTATPMNYGGVATDFGKLANLADKRVTELCRGDSPKWIPCVETVNDGSIVSDNVGKYAPNAWGLYDMHGNVWEWTLSTYKPYPYNDGDGRNDMATSSDKVVRGGSWYDRPKRATSSYRLAYRPWQRVSSVGFRVVCLSDDTRTAEK